MASSKFYKLLQKYGFREFNPPLSTMFESKKRFFQKKIIKGDSGDYDTYLDVYVYDAVTYTNGNTSPGYIQFESSLSLFGSDCARSKIIINFQEGSNIDSVIKLVIDYHKTVQSIKDSR